MAKYFLGGRNSRQGSFSPDLALLTFALLIVQSPYTGVSAPPSPEIPKKSQKGLPGPPRPECQKSVEKVPEH